MILNILLIIILFVVFYRIAFKSISESYENPFIYSTPYIDKNRLTYTPVPYVPETDPQTMSNIISDVFIEKNNKLIIDYADNSNFIINDNKVKNVKILSFAEAQLLNGDGSKCLDIKPYTNIALMTSCDLSKPTQKWTLINNNIKNNSNSQCLSFVNDQLMVLSSCNSSSIKQSWVPDTNNLLHNLNDYGKCLEIKDDDYIKLNVCDNKNNKQIWKT
jgi:hypothetical protein